LPSGRQGVNSIPDLELMGNSKIGIAYLKKNGFGIDKFGIEVHYQKKIHKLIYHLIF